MKEFLIRVDKPIAALAIIFFLSIAAMIWHVSSLQSSLLKSSAINTARVFSHTLTEVRSLYSAEVVPAARAYGMDVTHDYLGKDNAIPLPATFSMRLGELSGKYAWDAQSQLYSAYPFP